MYKLGWDQFLPFIVTVIAIQFSDLLKGIGIGMVVSLFFILRSNYKRAYFFHKEDHHEGEKITIQLAEDVTFLNKGSIALTLGHLPENSSVIIDGSKSHSIDMDVLEIIYDFKSTAALKNITLVLKNIPEFKGISGH
jgi:MFS superfamily sulfate permease-like transporter